MFKKTLAALASVLLVAGSAQAAVIAAWDFSQFFGPGAPTIDGASLVTTVTSNYSDFDPTFGAGADSGFGTLYLDGTNGSTGTPGMPSTTAANFFQPTTDQITLLQTLPQNAAPTGDVPFDSCTVLQSPAEGMQTFCEDVSMIASTTVSVTFGFDLTSAPGGNAGNGFSLDFAGFDPGGSSIGVETSADGSAFAAVAGTFTLGATEAPVNIPLGTALDGLTQGFVRLTFDADSVIDNFGISGTIVPEPGTAMLMMLGLVGLSRAGRRRSS